MSFELTDRDKFAVVNTCCDGPMVSYWANWKDVIGLLSAYNHPGCAPTVSVWQRKSSKSRWFCI